MLHKDVISIGVLIDFKEEQIFKNIVKDVIDKLKIDLIKDFNEFNWQFNLVERKDFIREVPVDPLELLDYGSSLKLEYNFDFVLVLTSLPLKPRFNQYVNAVPSNMLETAVISFSRLIENRNEFSNKSLIALLKHNLGHLWGLEHSDDSVMKPRNVWTDDVVVEWNKEEIEHIKSYLKKIADPRLEETTSFKLNKFFFYIKFLKQEGIGILRDIITFRSWLTILHLSKFITTIVMSTIFLFLTAEFWELGAALEDRWIYGLVIFVLLGVTFSLYFGHNLDKIARSDKLKEQAVRSKIVIIGILFIGILALWIFLFIISSGIIYLLPENVLLNWSGLKTHLPIFHFAVIISNFGIMMSAFGGNLEEEDDLKAILFYTEET